MKKRKTSKKVQKNSDLEHGTRVLLENMSSDIKRVAEGHSTIIRKLEAHDAQFVSIDQRFNRIETVVTDTNKQVKEIKGKITDHETRITKLEEKIHA